MGYSDFLCFHLDEALAWIHLQKVKEGGVIVQTLSVPRFEALDARVWSMRILLLNKGFSVAPRKQFLVSATFFCLSTLLNVSAWSCCELLFINTFNLWVISKIHNKVFLFFFWSNFFWVLCSEQTEKRNNTVIFKGFFHHIHHSVQRKARSVYLLLFYCSYCV